MSKKLKLVIAVMLVMTCLAAIIHISQQEDIACMVIKTGATEITVDFTDLDRKEFSGELVNGKGEVSFHSYTGVLLRDLLEEKGIAVSEISSVSVTSADNYSVTFEAEEILEDGRVHAAITVDGNTVEGIDDGTAGVQIIVFGDSNSKRCVRYAIVIEVDTCPY